MALKDQHLQIIRESVKDEAAYHRILDLIEELQADSAQNSQKNLDLDAENVQFQLLQAVIESIPLPTYVKDLQSRFVVANQMTVEMVGLETFTELQGKTDFDLYPKDVANYHFDEEQDIFTTGNPMIEKELTSIHENGFQDWHRSTKAPIRDQNGNIIGLIGINRETTEEKYAQMQLVEERNLLRTIIDNVHDKIYIKDRKSRFVLGNKATLEAHQCAHKDLVGKTDFDFVTDEQHANELYDEEQYIMETGKPVMNTEYRIEPYWSTDRTDRWFLVSKIPLIDESGEVTGLVGVNRDITSNKFAEQQRIELELERERSKILSEFITSSSHEFRTPISTIQTATYLMRNAGTFEQIQLYVNRIETQTKRITELLESLHTMSRLDKNPEIVPRSIHLNGTLSTLFSQMREEFLGRFIEAKLDIDSSADVIYGDPALLSIAINAILENAVRYTPKHGIVTLHSYIDNGIPIIEVTDTGIGMTDKVISKIFQRFYRADVAHSTKGFGLGLSIANKIIELHNGYIEVTSAPHIGSTFRIILPQPEMLSEDKI